MGSETTPLPYPLTILSGQVSNPPPTSHLGTKIESHWDGIASYCHPNNKVSLGLVEGINNKIKVLQRRAYGYRDEEYLKLKIVAAFLPPLPRNADFNPYESA